MKSYVLAKRTGGELVVDLPPQVGESDRVSIDVCADIAHSAVRSDHRATRDAHRN